MPTIGYYEEPDLVQTSAIRAAAPTSEDHTFASSYISGLTRTPGEAIAGAVLGSIVDLADTVGSSVLPGVERQDINNKFLNAVGSPGVSAWFNENRGSIEVGSGIAGVIASDYLAGRVLKPAGFAMQAIRSVPFAKKIATLDAQYERARRVAQITQTEVARRGLTGVDRFIGANLTVPAIGVGSVALNRGKATANLFGAQLSKGLARNATTEAIMATTLHTNDFLYSDDVIHNIAWGAAGLGLGAGIDSAIGAYTLRKMANSESIRQLNRKAYDVTGLETQRLNAFSVVDSVLRTSGVDPKELGYMFKGSGGDSDLVTSLAIQAAENYKVRGTSERARTLFGKREQAGNQMLELAHQESQKITTRGIRGAKNSGFHLDADGLGAPWKESIARNPTFTMGLEEVGTVVADQTIEQTVKLRGEFFKKRLDRINKIMADGGIWKKSKNKDGTWTDSLTPLKDDEFSAMKAERDELIFANSAVPKVMLEPGEWAPLSHAKITEGWNPREIITEGGLGNGNKAVWQLAPEPGKARLGIDSDGELFLPDGKARIEQLDPTQMLDLYRIGRKFVNHYKNAGEQFIVPKNPNWFQLDLAEQVMHATGDSRAVVFQGNLTRETAAIESFAQKVDLLRRREKAMGMAKATIDDADAFKNKVMFNLPRIDNYTAGLMQTTESPIDLLLAGFKSGDEVRQMPYPDLLKVINDARKIQGLTEETVDSVKGLHGNSFNFLMDTDGRAIKPVIGFQRPMSPYEWTRDDLFIRHGMKESHLRASLMGETADPLTADLVTRLSADPAFAQARKVMELADDQHRSFVPGARQAAPQTTTGAFMNAITSRARRDADSPTMLAASAVQELKTRIIQSTVKDIFTANMGETVTQLTSTRNARSLMLMNQVLSHGTGWEFMDELADVTLPSGERAKALVLNHESVLNQRRFQEQYGRPLEKGQELLNPQGNSIVLDQLASEAFSRMQLVHQQTLQAKNTALRSQGLPEIRGKNWYVPPPSTKGKYVGFTFDLQNNVVPGMTIVANSPEQLAEMSAALAKSDQWKDGYRVRTRDNVKDFMTLWDKAQMDFIAPNTTAIQPGKQNFGRTAGNEMNPRAFEEALVTMRDSLISHGDDVLELLFDDVIKAAMARSEVAKVESAVGQQTAKHSSIYDRFAENLMGRNALNAKDSFFGDAYKWAEDRINGFLKSPAAQKPAIAAQALSDWIRAAVPGKSPTGELFNQFAQELGQYMPYKSAEEMVMKATQARVPDDVAAISSKLSWFEAASRLRWFESMHAVVNMGSMIANTPAIIKALQPKLGESLADAAARNSSLTMAMKISDDGKGIVLPNLPKLMWQGMNDQWAKDPGIRKWIDDATKLGFMDQEVAEFQRAWGAIDSKAGWRGFMFGNEGATGKGIGAKLQRSGGIDKWLGVLSDKSEHLSRQWGMLMGRRVANAIGLDHNASIQFAHELTNKMIANYDPRNRPEIFQGPLGATIGLFQSYVINYYQRMFRYLETQDTRSLAIQAASQSAIFGTASLPGWDALNWAFFDQGQAKGDDPVESMYKRFGTADADLIMHGTLSNLPKLFGAEGASLYTRGDSALRLPGSQWQLAGGVVPVPNLPVADTLSRLAGGLGQAFKTLFQVQGGMSMTHLAEIASNVITNRPIAGMIETLGAGGYDTTFDGQVASEATTATESAYRWLGIRSMAQQKSIDSFYANKTSMEEQAARQDILRGETRSAIRAGDMERVPELFKQYVENGGSPRYYTRWLKESFAAAQDTRSERALDKALRDPQNASMAAIGRLLDGQTDIADEDANPDDYGRQAQIDQLARADWQQTPSPDMSPAPEPGPMRPEDQLYIQ